MKKSAKGIEEEEENDGAEINLETLQVAETSPSPDNMANSIISLSSSHDTEFDSGGGGNLGINQLNSKQPLKSADGMRLVSSSLLANFDSGTAVGDYDMKKSPSTAAFVQEIIEQRYLNKARQKLIDHSRGNVIDEETSQRKGIASSVLSTLTETVIEGVDAIGEDEFWKCFEKTKVPSWNWNFFLSINWILGVCIRYFLLFPLRLALLSSGWIIFFFGMVFSFLFLSFFKKQKKVLKKV